MPINESSSSFAATDAGIQQKINKNKNKKNAWFWNNNFNNFK